MKEMWEIETERQDRLDKELDSWILSTPKCDCCKDHVGDLDYYEIEGFTVCEECLPKFRKHAS